MKKQVEPIILTVALVLLGVGAALFAYFYPSVPDITGIPALAAQGKNVLPLKAEDVAASLANWASPTFWEEPPSHNRLFHSDKYLFFASIYPSGDFIKRLDKDTRLPSGMLISWCDAHQLDITDVNIDREDPDGDGFSNLTEYKNEPVGVRYDAHKLDGSQSTDPNDAKSHPAYLSRLRLQKYEQQPFHIFFEGYQQLNGVYLFQLRLSDEPSYNQPPLKKTGDALGFGGYVVGPFQEAHQNVMDPNTHTMVSKDVSTLELDQTETGNKVVVPFRDEKFNSPEVTADFVMLMPSETDKVIRISAGKTFSVPFLPGSSFLMKEANDNGATIVQQSDGKSYHILKLEDSEWNEIPQPPAPKQP
jgi:hypothetical protein